MCHYPFKVTSTDSGSADRRRGSPRAVVLGRIAGVPVAVAPSWALSIVVIGALGVPIIMQTVPSTETIVAVAVSVLLGILLGASVLAHELGHCLSARLLGMSVVSVRLYLLGGVSELQRLPRNPREEALIAAAGPAVSGVLAGVFWLLAQLTEPGAVTWLLLVLLALSNVVIALFNLLPALPLDGGRVLRAGVWQLTGNRRRGTSVAVLGGYVIAALLAGWAVAVLIADGVGGLLPAGVAVAMAVFVVVGAAAQRGRRKSAAWPADITLLSLAHPVAQLPAEAPVEFSLQAAERRSVLLVSHDGLTRGVLDIPAAHALAVEHPRAPSSLAARLVPPEAIVLADDDPAEVMGRISTMDSPFLLLIDATGQPTGLLTRADILAVAGHRRGRGRTSPGAAVPPPAPDGASREKNW